jgi:flagellar FliJ protein
MASGRPFQYATLLRIRKRQEDLKAQALALAHQQAQRAREERAGIASEQRRTLEQAGELVRARFDASEVRRYYQYERHLSRLGDTKDAEIRQLDGVVEEKRLDLEEAAKQKQVVEKLQERRMAAYQKEQLKQEQKVSDEVATNYAAMGLGRRKSDAKPVEERDRR